MNLFAYGTLMWPEVMAAIIGHCPGHEPATLEGYVRLRRKGAHYPVVVPSASDSVQGKLYSGLSEQDFAALDAFEGEEYERRTLVAGSKPAEVYVLSPRWRDVASTDPWLPESFGPEHFRSLVLDPS